MKVTKAMEAAWVNWDAPVINPDFRTEQFMRTAFMAGFAKGMKHKRSKEDA